MRGTGSPEAFDVVVVGSGTGLLAAVTASELGLRVLVVEKSQYLGGSTAMSGGGFWIPGNSVLADLGVADSRERASAYLDALVGDRAPRERRESFLDHGPAAVGGLRRNAPHTWQHMREYPDYFPEVEGGSAFGLFALSLSWAWTTLGLLMRTPQAVMSVGTVVLFPLTLASNVFVRPQTMPGWLQAFVNVNPVSHLVTAERGLMDGQPAAGQVAWVLLASAALVAVFAPATTYLYGRRR